MPTSRAQANTKQTDVLFGEQVEQEVAGADQWSVSTQVFDLVPNPFAARGIIAALQAAPERRGFDPVKLGGASGVIIDALRLALIKERDMRAEALFRQDVKAGRIQFRLRLDGDNWPMPETVATTEPLASPHLTGVDGGALVRSLFSPVLRTELNGEEQIVAVHLYGEAAVKWWYRNVAKTNYGLQGWKRGRIYPDFIFATDGHAVAGRIVILETKGEGAFMMMEWSASRNSGWQVGVFPYRWIADIAGRRHAHETGLHFHRHTAKSILFPNGGAA